MVEKKEFNFDEFCNSCAIVNAYWVTSNHLLMNLFNSETQTHTHCFYNIMNDKIDRISFPDNGRILDDSYGNYCLVSFPSSTPYQAAIYEMDVMSMEFTMRHKIYAKRTDDNPVYRLGFVFPSKIARMTIVDFDFTSFSPFLNQVFNLIDIRIERVD